MTEYNAQVSRECILIVDDDAVILRLMEAILSTHGYSTLSAENGRTALELSRNHSGPIDLVVTDVRMPQMDGVTLCRYLAHERPEAAFLLISGECSSIDNAMGIQFLPKPFTVDQLVLKVRQLLRRPALRTMAAS